MAWRSYSTRSSYPLANSSRTRRRLLLYREFGVAEEDAEPVADDIASPFAPFTLRDDAETHDAHGWDAEHDPDYADEDSATIDASEFIDEAFTAEESRNELLASGAVSESVLDDDEDTFVDPASESSVLSSYLGDESKVLAHGRDEGSRILSLHDFQDAASGDSYTQSPDERSPHLPEWYVPTFKTVKRMLDGDKPLTWVVSGDNLSHPDRTLAAGHDYAEQLGERVRVELRRTSDVLIQTGTAAATAEQLVEELEWRLLRFHPEVVLLMLGVEDSAAGQKGRVSFVRNLKQIVKQVRAAGSVLILQTPHRIDLTRASRYNDIRPYVRMVRDVASERQVLCVDHWSHWKQSRPNDTSWSDWLEADGVHPTPAGHREIARLLFQKLGIYDERSALCRAE